MKRNFEQDINRMTDKQMYDKIFRLLKTLSSYTSAYFILNDIFQIHEYKKHIRLVPFNKMEELEVYTMYNDLVQIQENYKARQVSYNIQTIL